ncbi:P-loop containing nucleoside triphosphate hydrolase protein [Aspergillus tamarii]|uniref:P-loop containing nucleoside triphosphate hydrolase protein n=1 Tax=Aspergillus tamarii TaxID=41984 RepID=A0A5N6UND9_ASPTM|nr:P-loop containing nucleoside triphosphate hydrolase protein [Aspergillus tamarii]
MSQVESPNFSTDVTAQESPSKMRSLENKAIQVIARDMKALVRKIQDLRHIGIEDNRIALPKICVIGDQSTGKSSLIEGMSEIKVPRSAGTCTRCPMEINLSEGEPSQPWVCQIYLSRRYMYDGSRKLRAPRKAQPLGPWIEQDQEDEHFITLSDKDQVQEAIKWAQLAILNPGQSSREYIPGKNLSTNTHYQVKFSPNIAGESYSQWVDILEGYKFKLGHGYYIVRNNPDPAIEHSQAREEEDDFFASPPWTAEELAPYQDRFGTCRLQTSLSSLLLEQIQGCLPGIIEQIDTKAARINEELKELPDPPSANVLYILCKLVYDLGDRIRANFEGGSSDYPLLKIWGHIAQDFRAALIRTRPTVSLLSQSDRASFPVQPDGDSDCEMTSAPRPVKRKSPNVPPDRQTPKPGPSGYFTDHFNQFVQSARVFTWENIREINEDSCRAGIPDQADPKALEKLRQLSVEHWDGPMLVFLKATHNLVKEMLLKQLKEVFSQYYQTTLFRELKRIIEKYLGELQEQHTKYAVDNYNIEHHKPFTMATAQLEHATKDAHHFLSTQRHLARANLYLGLQGKYPENDARKAAELKKLTAAELGPDRFFQEVKMMASTRGYYEVASSRFVDSTCQGIHTRLFSKCREELVSVIENELHISDTDGMSLERCQELMAPDLERQRRRQYLLKEKKKITQAQEWLSAIKKEENEESSRYL